MIDRKRSMFISTATLQLLLICMIFTLHDMNQYDTIRMIGVNAQQQRTCDVSKNKKVLLYYNATKGMYIPYDDITINVAVVNDSTTNISSMTNNTNTRRQTRRRNRERRMNDMVQDHQRINHPVATVHLDGFIRRLIDYFVGNVDDDEDENGYVYEYSNDYSDMNHDLVQSVPAIQIINPKTLPIDDYTVDSRNLAATLASLRNRDADGVYDINPHIQLYEPTDGKIIEVRPCHCVNSWNDPNPNFYCPIDKRNCFVPRMVSSSSTSASSPLDYPNHPVCLNAPSARWYFAKYLKLLGLVSFILIIVILCVSPYGRHAIRFCCKPFGCFNKRYIHHVIDKKSDERNQLLQRYMKVREDQYTKRFKELQRLHGEIDENDNENDGTGDTAVPVSTQQKRKVVPLNEIDESIIHDIYYYRPSLLLKTRIYETNKVSSSTMNDEQNDDVKTTTIQSSLTDGTSDPNDTTTSMNDTDQSNHNDNSNNNNTKKEDSCMICFSTFEDGCKVGVLPNCSHTFHSKCLKDWLKRRNVCPLCLESDVATTAFSYKTIRNTTTIPTTNNNSTDTDETLR